MTPLASELMVLTIVVLALVGFFKVIQTMK